MKLKPGCGCLVVIVALLNFLFAVLVVFGLIRGSTETHLCPDCGFEWTVESSFGVLTLTFALLFLVNGFVTFTVGWANFRGRRSGSPVGGAGGSLGLGDE
jgi:D-alanyl-lipoteichoic acid acyltransferase DltB (MBOAT superfamily)